jgi:hypothetical protein
MERSRPRRCSAMPSPQAEHCRRKAEECEQEAKQSPSPSLTRTWLNLARQWREMADRIGKERREPDRLWFRIVQLWRRRLVDKLRHVIAVCLFRKAEIARARFSYSEKGTEFRTRSGVKLGCLDSVIIGQGHRTLCVKKHTARSIRPLRLPSCGGTKALLAAFVSATLAPGDCHGSIQL